MPSAKYSCSGYRKVFRKAQVYKYPCLGRQAEPWACIGRARLHELPASLVFLLYQKGRDSRIFQAQDGYDRRDSEQQQVTADEDRVRSSRFRTTTSYCGRGSRTIVVIPNNNKLLRRRKGRQNPSYPVISESYRG